jgi:hypothetical protein
VLILHALTSPDEVIVSEIASYSEVIEPLNRLSFPRFQQVLDRPGEPLHLNANGGGDMAETGLQPENPQTDFVTSQGGFGVVTINESALTVELRDVHGNVTHDRWRER